MKNDITIVLGTIQEGLISQICILYIPSESGITVVRGNFVSSNRQQQQLQLSIQDARDSRSTRDFPIFTIKYEDCGVMVAFNFQ